MEEYYTEETFLARWIANELSDEELAAFKKTDAYKQLSIIDRESQVLDGPEVNTELALQKVTRQLQSSKGKPKIKRLWIYAAAAGVTLLIGFFVFFNATKSYSTGIGEKQFIALADGSEVYLNANSRLTHQLFLWMDNKEVHLEGEAYFEVAGGNFKVHTSRGTVAVLGTKFNLKDRTDFEIECYEGRISFTPTNGDKATEILEGGMKLKILDDKTETMIFSEKGPRWQRGVSVFEDQPLSVVLAELENYYSIIFETRAIRADRLFTGEFTHEDLNTALEATLTPMGISYTFSKDGKTIILSE